MEVMVDVRCLSGGGVSAVKIKPLLVSAVKSNFIDFIVSFEIILFISWK